MCHRHLYVTGGGAATEQGDEHRCHHRIEQEEVRPQSMGIIRILSNHKIMFFLARYDLKAMKSRAKPIHIVQKARRTIKENAPLLPKSYNKERRRVTDDTRPSGL